MEEATFLTRFASKVVIIHRRDEFRASPIMVDRARENEKVEFVLNAVVDEVLGEGTATSQVSGCATRRPAKHARSRRTACSSPSVTTRRRRCSSTGSITTTRAISTEPRSTRTNIPGVFAAGDVQDHTYRQAVTAAGPGRWPRSMLSAGSRSSATSPRSPPLRRSGLRPHHSLRSRTVSARWLDLVDPSREELLATLPIQVDP